MMPWIVVICLFMALLEGYFMEVASSSRLPDVYWNSSNPIFRIDNTDHIIDVNRGNNPFDYDQINIICPYSKGTKEEGTETYIIYNVSKEEYESCHISDNNPRIVAVCNRPQQLMYFTITFRSFTPQPGGLEFKPGQDYYFISTSDGSNKGLYQRNGGRCSSHNMKLIFKICCTQSGDTNNNNNNNNNDNNNSNNNKNNNSKDEQNIKNNKISQDGSAISPSSNGLSPSLSSSPSSSQAKTSSIILSAIKSNISVNNSINNSISYLSSSSMSDENIRNNPTIRPSNNHNNNNRNLSRKTNQSTGHHVDQSEFGHLDNKNNFLSNNSIINIGQSSSTSRPLSTSDSSVPYWWRPHFKILPGLKHNLNNNNNNNINDQISNELPRNDQEWTPHKSNSNANDKNNSDEKTTESSAWLIVVGAAVAVGVACLIVCTLYTCTNYLFFPPRRKDHITK